MFLERAPAEVGQGERSPRQGSSPLAAQLAELADAEAATLRQRHKAREAAVRRYEVAKAKVEQAEHSIAAGRDEQVVAVVALLETGRDAWHRRTARPGGTSGHAARLPHRQFARDELTPALWCSHSMS